MSYLSIESTVRHWSVGICYLLDKCIHALIDDIYIDTSLRKRCTHNSHTYKIQLNELIVVCWMKCNMVYLYALKSHLLFWDKDIGKEAIFFRRRKEANEWVSVSVSVYVMEKKGRPLRSYSFKECPSLVFITIESCVMTEFNDVDI